MKPVTVTVKRYAAGTPERAFEVIPPIDLPAVFTGYGPLPAVTGVIGGTNGWETAGAQRTVELRGGGLMSERLVEVRRPGLFAYEVTPVRGPLVLLVDHIEGRFEFTPSGTGTEISWSYSFIPLPRRRLALLLLAPLWRRYAEQVVRRCAEAVDA